MMAATTPIRETFCADMRTDAMSYIPPYLVRELYPAPPPTSHRRTQDEIAVCYECGQDIDAQPVRLDSHEFCSRECLDAWVRR